MKCPEFTPEQVDWICYQIGEWYLNWKDRIVDYDDKTHQLGYAKEVLKEMIYPTRERQMSCITEKSYEEELKKIVKENLYDILSKDREFIRSLRPSKTISIVNDLIFFFLGIITTIILILITKI